MRLAFIGAGKMATAIAQGLIDKDVCAAATMAAADVAPAARQAFQAATGVHCRDAAVDILAAADTVVLAVKPQVAQAAVAPLQRCFAGKLVISICAGLTLTKLCGWLGTDRVIRVMPNTPLMVGKGASVFACAAGVTAADKELCNRIFGSLGSAYELQEDKIDAVTALSGSGPAYIFETVQGLVDAGVAVGLPPEVAFDLTVQTVAGAAEMLARRLGTPEALRNAVTSPGGTTAAGLAVFAKADYRQLLKAVVTAARDRSLELGKG